MLRILVMGGPYAILLSLLAIVILALSLKKTRDLFGRNSLTSDQMNRGLNAILFWGGFAAVLGFLGQFSATYKSLMIIRSAEMINPSLVAEGFAVSLITTLMGLTIFALAGLIWFGLRCRLQGLQARRVEA